MRMKDRIDTLEAQNAQLRAKVSALTSIDTEGKWSICGAVNAVARNLAPLQQLERKRTLLAVAVLYGIIKPA